MVMFETGEPASCNMCNGGMPGPVPRVGRVKRAQRQWWSEAQADTPLEEGGRRELAEEDVRHVAHGDPGGTLR